MIKKVVLLPLSLISLALGGCNFTSSGGRGNKKSTNTDGSVSGGSITSITSASDTSMPTDISIPSITSTSIDWGGDVTDTFSIVDANGEENGFSVDNSVYTITTAGTYTLSGKLVGQIVINAGSSDTVELDLSGVDISYASNSPIRAISVDKLKIKSIKDTVNRVVDNRANKVADSDEQGEGAIAGKCDMNIIGSGQLYVEGNYNNGIHTSKDLKIKNTQLRVIGHQHALRGGNSIEITNTATYIEAVGQTGDGLKSNDAGLTSKGKQKGNINIYGGTLIVNACNDGIDAAYNVNISSGTDDETNETTIPSIAIYTETYAKLTKSISRPAPGGGGWDNGGNTNKSATTAKGIKGNNSVNISEGNIYIEAYDDGIHANTEPLTDSDDVETGVNGEGNITISGGTTAIKCADDGMHADNILSITGGNVLVSQSYEGLEGHQINISGGVTRVTGSDDGLNAGGEDSPSIIISGGFVEVTVSPNGDTDGIDSNGTYTQTGGVVITKGPNSQNSSALDHEGTANINGGTLVVLGAIEGASTRWGGGTPPGGGGSGNVTIGSGMNTYNLSLHSKGDHSITRNGVTYYFTNASAYGKTTCYSDVEVTGN